MPNPSLLSDPNAMLTKRDLAQLTGFTRTSLDRWAAKGRGPRITRIEGFPRYRASDVLEWMESGGRGADAKLSA